MLERVEVNGSEFEQYKVEEGDVFFCRSSLKPEGVAWTSQVSDVKEPAVFECHLIRARVEKSVIIPAFLSHYSRSSLARGYLVAHATVTTMATIDQPSVESLPIILPPLNIQENLVLELEAAREECQVKLAQADELLSSLDTYLLAQLGITTTKNEKRQVFAVKAGELKGSRLDVLYHNPSTSRKLSGKYDSLPLSSLVKMISGGTPSKSSTEFWEGEIPWISPKDFSNYFIDDTEDHISEEGMKDARLTLIPAKSVLVVVRSGVLQHTLPVVLNSRPVTINQDIKALIPNSKINAEFLGVYLRVLGERILPSITKHSTTVQSVNTDQLQSLLI